MNYIAFVIPVVVSAGSFPFLGSPNRSLFSEAVDLVPELQGFEGTMQGKFRSDSVVKLKVYEVVHSSSSQCTHSFLLIVSPRQALLSVELLAEFTSVFSSIYVSANLY